VDDDASMCTDTCHRLAVDLGSTSSAPKELCHVLTCGNFSAPHEVPYVTQGRALQR